MFIGLNYLAFRQLDFEPELSLLIFDACNFLLKFQSQFILQTFHELKFHFSCPEMGVLDVIVMNETDITDVSIGHLPVHAQTCLLDSQVFEIVTLNVNMD